MVGLTTPRFNNIYSCYHFKGLDPQKFFWGNHTSANFRIYHSGLPMYITHDEFIKYMLTDRKKLLFQAGEALTPLNNKKTYFAVRICNKLSLL